ncbi:hypothetical protein [Mycolicibacterium litorale]|uniref:hypothetical protein n=1 Tax=Mycolicibacterium litorale TaxID=758802 RepID=UPI0021F2CA27|nr:hypothetical protein [Mycolicibacterium litorale]MCV7413719.1 hypothetical protein [Mycolicibacterium litorale]
MSIGSDGAGEVTEIHTYSDGRVYTEITHDDGTSFATDHRPGKDQSDETISRHRDGSVHTSRTDVEHNDLAQITTTTTTHPGGVDTLVVTAVHGPAGDHVIREFEAADGTREVRTEFPDGQWQEIRTLPDGSSSSTTFVLDAHGGSSTIEVDASGAQTVVTQEFDPATNTTTTTTRSPDGHAETVLDRAYVKPDGSRFSEHVAADGTRTTRLERLDGSSDETTLHTDGTTETAQRVLYPDGSSMHEVVHADGTRESTLMVPRPDGSTETVFNASDGTTVRMRLAEDGSVDRHIHREDGSSERTILGPEGMGTKTITAADGSTMVLDQWIDPVLTVDRSLVPDDLTTTGAVDDAPFADDPLVLCDPGDLPIPDDLTPVVLDRPLTSDGINAGPVVSDAWEGPFDEAPAPHPEATNVEPDFSVDVLKMCEEPIETNEMSDLGYEQPVYETTCQDGPDGAAVDCLDQPVVG